MERLKVPAAPNAKQFASEQSGLERLMQDLEKERETVCNIQNDIETCLLAQQAIASHPEKHYTTRIRAERTIERLKQISANIRKLFDLPDHATRTDPNAHLGARRDAE